MSKELIQELNVQVSSWSVMYAKLHNYHWYVKGQSIFHFACKIRGTL